jgi:hypothetical protein
MARHVFLVNSNPTEGKEEEYNDWYDNVHLAEVVEVPGIVSAQRLKYSGASFDPESPSRHGYIALYEIDVEGDPAAVLDTLRSMVEKGDMVVPDSITDIDAWIYSPITSVVREPAAA